MKNTFTNYQSSATSGYLILSGVFSVMMALAFQDAMFLTFGFFTFGALALAASIDKGTVSKDLQFIGIYSENIYNAIPMGILGGVVAMLIGSIVVSIEIMKTTIPDLTSISSIFTASIIPPSFAMTMNLIGQLFVIAPSEEALSKILGPFAYRAIFKSIPIAFGLSALSWIAMHIPTYVMQGTTPDMYIVLIILYVITLFLYLTYGWVSAALAHFTYNAGVLISSSNDIYGFTTLGIIGIIILYIWVKNPKKSRN